MIKTFILSLTILTLSQFSKGQNDFRSVNRKEVQKLVTDSSAKTYYPRLISRFLADDPDLTMDDYRLLYYGFVFQDNYKGYPDLKLQEINDAVRNKKYESGLKLCDSVLTEYPINLFGNYNKGFILFMLNKEDSNYIKYRDRYRKIRNAIISSGDGLTCKTAFKTIFVNDEYQIMYNYFEVNKFKGQALISQCDRMSIEPSENFKADEMFFDTSETLLNMERILKKN